MRKHGLCAAPATVFPIGQWTAKVVVREPERTSLAKQGAIVRHGLRRRALLSRMMNRSA